MMWDGFARSINVSRKNLEEINAVVAILMDILSWTVFISKHCIDDEYKIFTGARELLKAPQDLEGFGQKLYSAR